MLLSWPSAGDGSGRTGARIATRSARPATRNGTIGRRRRRARAQTGRRWRVATIVAPTAPISCRVSVVAISLAASVDPNAWVKAHVEQIDDEVDTDEHGCGKQHGCLDDWIVAAGCRSNREPPDSGPGEDRLGDGDTAKAGREIEATDRDDRDRGVLERVYHDNAQF